MTTRGRPFQGGKSGNPAGKAKGTRHRTTIAMEALLEGEAESLTRTAIELAQGGDTVALRLCLDRLIPVRKDRPVRFALPEIEATTDLPRATNALLQAVAAGDLTPSEAADIGRAVDAHVKAIEASDLHRRLAAIEEAMTSR